MAETSGGRVTITLGGSGRVIKRAAATAPDMDLDSLPGAGSKRSARERLGSRHKDGSLSFTTLVSNNKRRKGESYERSSSSCTLEDVGINRDDLRFKLMEKNLFRRVQSGDDRSTVDLREKLSRMAQPPAPAQVPPTFNRPDVRLRIPENTDSSMSGRFSHNRSVENLPLINSTKSSYNPWTLDHIRRRSPGITVGGSRGLSPPRKMGEPVQVPLRRGCDSSGAASYVSRDVVDGPRSTISSKSGISTSALPSIKSKPAASEMAHFPASSGIVRKSPYMVDEQQTVEGLLNSLGLEKYAVIFKAEEVDLTTLKQMRESDLKELGIPMGPRKKILLALSPHSNRRA